MIFNLAQIANQSRLNCQPISPILLCNIPILLFNSIHSCPQYIFPYAFIASPCFDTRRLKAITEHSSLIAPLGSDRRRFRSKAKKEHSSLNPQPSSSILLFFSSSICWKSFCRSTNPLPRYFSRTMLFSASCSGVP